MLSGSITAGPVKRTGAVMSPWSSKSSSVRYAPVSSACGCTLLTLNKTRAEEGLLIEWPKREVEPIRYWPRRCRRTAP